MPYCREGRPEAGDGADPKACAPIPTRWWLSGLAASTVLCTAVLSPMFRLPVRSTASNLPCPLVVAHELAPQGRVVRLINNQACKAFAPRAAPDALALLGCC